MKCLRFRELHARRLCPEKRDVSAPGAVRQQNIIDTKFTAIAMRLSSALALLTLACLFASAPAAGEDAPLDLSLTPGMRVRVLAPDISPSKVVGTISRVDNRSVTIDVPG